MRLLLLADQEDEECSKKDQLAYLITVAASYCWVTPKYMDALVTNIYRELCEIQDLAFPESAAD